MKNFENHKLSKDCSENWFFSRFFCKQIKSFDRKKSTIIRGKSFVIFILHMLYSTQLKFEASHVRKNLSLQVLTEFNQTCVKNEK